MTTKERKIRNFDIFYNLTKRHLKVFFKNKIRVMYTLLVPIIILAVYIFFLRDLELTSVNAALAEMFKDSPEILKDSEFIRARNSLIDSWMLSGIISLSTITVSLQTNNIFVEDKENGIKRDFISSPINKNVLIVSYFAYNFIVTLLISVVVLLIDFLYLAVANEFCMSFGDVLLAFIVLLFTTIFSTLSTIFVCLFVDSEASLASIIAIVSTAAGFLIGAYMPISMLPTWVQNICAFMPGTYTTSLLRFTFLNTPINNLGNLLGTYENLNVDINQVIQLFINDYGYNVSFFGTYVTPEWQTLVVVIFIAIFLVLNIIFGGKLTILDEGIKKIKKKKGK